MVTKTCKTLPYSPDTQQALRISLRATLDAAIAEVEDRGIGIAADGLQGPGAACYRPDSARRRIRGGHGLGPKRCRLICAAHGGELRSESEPGQGNRLFVSLAVDNS